MAKGTSFYGTLPEACGCESGGLNTKQFLESVCFPKRLLVVGE